MPSASLGWQPLIPVPVKVQTSTQTTDLPRPFRPHTTARAMYRLHHLLDRHIPIWPVLASALKTAPGLYKIFTKLERLSKHQVFGCRMCGQCTLPVTGYACPATCPKQLRNGPCGGVGADGSCEVFPDTQCVWVTAYERAQREGRVADLTLMQRPVNHRRAGQSAWVSYWRGADEA